MTTDDEPNDNKVGRDQTNIDTGGGYYVDTGGGDYAGRDIDKRQGTFVTVQQAASLPPALHQLRAPVGDFVGREREIDQLVSELTAINGGAAAISGVRGMGGIGKTELAYAVANRIAAQFPDGQLLVELRGASSNPMTPAQALQTVIRSFEREVKLPDDISQLQALYRAKLTGKRALILADDAKDDTQVRPLLPPQGCALLVTSRNRFSLPGMRALGLGTLPSAEAESLLLEICPRIGEHAVKLAKLCAYLPLALRVCASLLEVNESQDLMQYLEQLRIERLKHMSISDNRDDPLASVEASLLLSYDALDTVAQNALRQMSVFPTSFTLEAAKAVVVVEGNVDEVLALLLRRSMLEWDVKLKRYSLHDLVQEFVAERLKHANTVRWRYARYYARLANQAGELYFKDELGGLALFDRERIHIDTGWQWALARAGARNADALLLKYTSALAYIGDVRYDALASRIPQNEAALDAARRLNDQRAEGHALSNLGWAYHFLGQLPRAVNLYEQALLIARQTDDRDGEAETLGNLTYAYRDLGEPQRAIEFGEQAIAIAGEIDDQYGKAMYLNASALVYVNLGEVGRAIEYYEQALALTRENQDRSGEGTTLCNMGQAYVILDEPQRAVALSEQGLTLCREARDISGVGESLNTLGNAYVALGDLERAINYCREAITSAQTGGYVIDEARYSWNLGLAMEKQGNFAQAVELMQVYVDYLREIGHLDANKHAARLDQLRQRLTGDEGGTVEGAGA